MRAILALLLLLTASAARAQCPPAYDWSGFYPPAILDRVARLTAPDLQSNFDQFMLPRLTDQQRRVLAGVSLDFGQREYPGHPLNFYAARGGRIVLPLSSVRLVTDLTLALAWMNRHRVPEKKVFDYAAMLAYRGPAPDGVRALPLAALGVPDNAITEAEVGDLFQKLLIDTMVFIVAHEMGHLFHNHQANVDAARSRLQESEADAFAVELMGRMGMPPVGISFYFTLATPFECPARSTHPLTGERVTRLAATLRDNAALFARDKPSPQHERQLIDSIGRELEGLARLLDDPDIREVHAPDRPIVQGRRLFRRERVGRRSGRADAWNRSSGVRRLLCRPMGRRHRGPRLSHDPAAARRDRARQLRFRHGRGRARGDRRGRPARLCLALGQGLFRPRQDDEPRQWPAPGHLGLWSPNSRAARSTPRRDRRRSGPSPRDCQILLASRR